MMSSYDEIHDDYVADCRAASKPIPDDWYECPYCSGYGTMSHISPDEVECDSCERVAEVEDGKLIFHERAEWEPEDLELKKETA